MNLPIPSQRLVIAACLPLALSLAVLVEPYAAVIVIVVDLLLFFVAAIDLSRSGGQVNAQREYKEVQTVGKEFEVAVGIENHSRRPLQLTATDMPPGRLTTSNQLPVSLVLSTNERGWFRYKIAVDDRGQHPFGPVAIRWRSPLGLWERQSRVQLDNSLRVYPNFAQLRNLDLDARIHSQRFPARARRRPGGENEFQRLRPYVSGDPYKHIDWKATAKRQEFITREFGQESNQNIVLLLDCGRLMSARHGDLQAFDHALNSAMMLGQLALRRGDRVGLLAFDSNVRVWLKPSAGARQGTRMIRATYDLQPSLEEPDFSLAFRYLATRVRRRSLVVLFTSIIDDVSAQLASKLTRGLSRRHLPMTVWLRDPQLDEALADDDPFHRGAAASLFADRERVLADLRRKGALVVDVNATDLTAALLSKYLEVKSRKLL